MDTVLLVEDDATLRGTLKECLEQEDFIVFEAALCRRSLEILARHKVDIVLLDMRLPDGNGLDIITDIRKHTDVPLIIVSGDNQLSHRVGGFDKGADDYVHKPFDMEELIARIRANLRRYKGLTSNQNGRKIIDVDGEQVNFGEWTLDRAQFQVFDDMHRAAGLTVHEFKLLDTLVTHAGQVLKREELCDALSVESYIPTPRAIDVKVARIRKKIGDDASNPQIIKTVHGAGYMFERRQ